MTTATEYLDAFNNSFVNKDKSFIDAIMADNCMIHFTGLDETMTRQECLEWSETDFCAGCAESRVTKFLATSKRTYRDITPSREPFHGCRVR